MFHDACKKDGKRPSVVFRGCWGHWRLKAVIEKYALMAVLHRRFTRVQMFSAVRKIPDAYGASFWHRIWARGSFSYRFIV